MARLQGATSLRRLMMHTNCVGHCGRVQHMLTCILAGNSLVACVAQCFGGCVALDTCEHCSALCANQSAVPCASTAQCRIQDTRRAPRTLPVGSCTDGSLVARRSRGGGSAWTRRTGASSSRWRCSAWRRRWAASGAAPSATAPPPRTCRSAGRGARGPPARAPPAPNTGAGRR